MIDVGIATAAMSVERKLRRKMKTTIAARMPPSTRCSSIACERRVDELRVVADQRTSTFGGSVCWISAMRALIASASATVLTPLCLRTATAGRPSVEHRDRRRLAAVVLDAADVADADRRVAGVATTRSLKSSGGRRRPTRAHRQLARALLDAAAGQLEVLRAQRRGHVGGRQAVGVEAIGVDLDLDLAAAGAEEQHLADAVDRLEAASGRSARGRSSARPPASAPRPRHMMIGERVGILLLDDRRIGGFRQVADRPDRPWRAHSCAAMSAFFERSNVIVTRERPRSTSSAARRCRRPC